MRVWVALVSVVMVLLSSSPASADVTDPFGYGLGGANSGMGILGGGSGWSLVDSAYTLDMFDPLSGHMVGPDLTMSMTEQHAAVSDMDMTAQLAFDAQLMAKQAQAQAEAKRLASLGVGNGKLKPGMVPSPYDALLEAEIGRCPGLPLGIVAAQIASESNWNPNARSPVGAIGLTQFMPKTWSGHGKDGNGDGKADPFNAHDSIVSAIEYDCYLLNMMKNDESLVGDDISLMLAAYNAGEGNVRKHRGIPPFNETRNYVEKITRLADTYATAGGETGAAGASQTSVGADGCPSSAPGNTLRDGAASVGVGAICASSVAQARTPEAAGAIKYMLNHLGEPYSQPKRNSPGYSDCSSYISAGYRAAGETGIYPRGSNAQTTRSFTAAEGKWVFRVPYDQKMPGDIIYPFPGHVALVLADGWMVHTNRTGDVSHVKRLYTAGNHWKVLRVDPSRI